MLLVMVNTKKSPFCRVKISLRFCKKKIWPKLCFSASAIGIDDQAGIILGTDGCIGIPLPPIAPGLDRIEPGGCVAGKFDTGCPVEDGITGVVQRIHVQPLVIIDVIAGSCVAPCVIAPQKGYLGGGVDNVGAVFRSDLC